MLLQKTIKPIKVSAFKACSQLAYFQLKKPSRLIQETIKPIKLIIMKVSHLRLIQETIKPIKASAFNAYAACTNMLEVVAVFAQVCVSMSS